MQYFSFLQGVHFLLTAGLDKYLYFGVRACISFKELWLAHVYKHFVSKWVSFCNFFFTCIPWEMPKL